MKNNISKRVEAMSFSGIRKFFDLVGERKDVISLGVGEPDFPTPEPIKDAAIRAIETDQTSYTSNYGLIELRQKIAEKLKKKNNITADPKKEILVTVGVSEALDLATRAILNPGDEVLVPDPGYVSYKANVWFSYAEPVSIPTKEEDGFRIMPEEIEKRITKKTKAIIISSPANPTGSVLSKKDLEEIADLCIEHDLVALSDEIYEVLVYDDEKHISIGSLNGMEERTITLNGFSKAAAFTGWRLGYAAGKPEYIEAMMKIHQYTILCAPTIAQYAAIESFQHEEYVRDMWKEYDRRRRLLVKGLNEIRDISCITPKGAFYAFPNITQTGLSSEKFAERLLNEGKVAAVPGNSFGECGEGHIRCAYCVSREDINEALGRIEGFVRTLK
jgi:aminotransferase